MDNVTCTVDKGLSVKNILEDIYIGENKFIFGKYKIESLLTYETGEAILFKCVMNDKKYVAKIYKNHKPKEEIVKILKSINHPNITNIIECGEYEDKYSEIYPYYEKGDLSKNLPLSYQLLEETIIPSINNALKELRSKGIIHRDIKPSNIFYKNEEGDIVLGDFGISSINDSDKSTIYTSQRLTEIYSSPEALDGQVSYKSDYYSLGITIYHFILGKHPYEGETKRNIIDIKIRGQIDIPDRIDGRFKELIRGLTLNNKDNRWGYEEVDKWLNKIDVEVKSNDNRISRSDEPYRLSSNEAYYTLSELAEGLANNWEEGKKHLYRRYLETHLLKFGQDLASKCMDCMEIEGFDGDLGLFELIYVIDPDYPLCWRGEVFKSFDELIYAIVTSDDIYKKNYYDLLVSGALKRYLINNNASNKLINEINNLLKSSNKYKSMDVILFKLIYILKPSYDFSWNNKINKSKNIEDFLIEDISNMDLQIILKEKLMSYYYKKSKVINKDELEKIDRIENDYIKYENLDISKFKLVYSINPYKEFNIDNKAINSKNDYINLVCKVLNENEINLVFNNNLLSYYLKETKYKNIRLAEEINKLEQEFKQNKNIQVLKFKLFYVLNNDAKFDINKKNKENNLEKLICKQLDENEISFIFKNNLLSFYFKDTKYKNLNLAEEINKLEEEFKHNNNIEVLKFKLVYILNPNKGFDINCKNKDSNIDIGNFIEYKLSNKEINFILINKLLTFYIDNLKDKDSLLKLKNEQLDYIEKEYRKSKDIKVAKFKIRYILDPNKKLYVNKKNESTNISNFTIESLFDEDINFIFNNNLLSYYFETIDDIKMKQYKDKTIINKIKSIENEYKIDLDLEILKFKLQLILNKDSTIIYKSQNINLDKINISSIVRRSITGDLKNIVYDRKLSKYLKAINPDNYNMINITKCLEEVFSKEFTYTHYEGSEKLSNGYELIKLYYRNNEPTIYNKECYIGDIRSSKKEGIGIVLYLQDEYKCMYVGNFRKGEINGNGRMVYHDSSFYLGEFSNGKLHGEGYLKYSQKDKNKCVCKGTWKNDDIYESIVYFNKDVNKNCNVKKLDDGYMIEKLINTNKGGYCKYIRETKYIEDVKEPISGEYGKIVYNDRSIYEGKLSYNLNEGIKYIGYGKVINSIGESYEGSFISCNIENGIIESFIKEGSSGKLIMEDGIILIGTWGIYLNSKLNKHTLNYKMDILRLQNKLNIKLHYINGTYDKDYNDYLIIDRNDPVKFCVQNIILPQDTVKSDQNTLLHSANKSIDNTLEFLSPISNIIDNILEYLLPISIIGFIVLLLLFIIVIIIF